LARDDLNGLELRRGPSQYRRMFKLALGDRQRKINLEPGVE
jgi:hypothetical protein